MIDFGGGCSSSCSCCDRGKTKSTPSPKTEVWTLDWSLTKDDSIEFSHSRPMNILKGALLPEIQLCYVSHILKKRGGSKSSLKIRVAIITIGGSKILT